mmetsp:Transcript_82306/g.172387  ORF Transcript_82306/g.172387 Transcript_82306/m.172387 type:complete len:200 (-) Transcript_82306:301-900(-)
MHLESPARVHFVQLTHLELEQNRCPLRLCEADAPNGRFGPPNQHWKVRPIPLHDRTKSVHPVLDFDPGNQRRHLLDHPENRRPIHLGSPTLLVLVLARPWENQSPTLLDQPGSQMQNLLVQPPPRMSCQILLHCQQPKAALQKGQGLKAQLTMRTCRNPHFGVDFEDLPIVAEAQSKPADWIDLTGLHHLEAPRTLQRC